MQCILALVLLPTAILAADSADIETTLSKRGGFSLVLDLIKMAGLLNDINNAENVTLFLPTDGALSQLPAGTIDSLKADVDGLKQLLGYHTVIGESIRIGGHGTQDREIDSSVHLPIRLNAYKTLHTYSAEGVNITRPNIKVDNGFVHALESTMTPPQGNMVDIITTRSDLTTVASLVAKAGIIDTIRNDHNITAFVPSNDAFKNLDPRIMTYLSANTKDLTEVLLYHVVDRLTLYSIGMKHTLSFPSSDHRHDPLMIIEDFSGGIFVNDAKIIEKDISATNGVLHVIEGVLIPARILVKIEDAGIIVG